WHRNLNRTNNKVSSEPAESSREPRAWHYPRRSGKYIKPQQCTGRQYERSRKARLVQWYVLPVSLLTTLFIQPLTFTPPQSPQQQREPTQSTTPPPPPPPAPAPETPRTPTPSAAPVIAPPIPPASSDRSRQPASADPFADNAHPDNSSDGLAPTTT